MSENFNIKDYLVESGEHNVVKIPRSSRKEAGGKYLIPDEHYDAFLKHAADTKICYAERPFGITKPEFATVFRIDFDLKLHDDDTLTKPFTLAEIVEFINKLHEANKELNLKARKFYVCLRNQLTQQGEYYRYGVHIFGNFRMSNASQLLIREGVLADPDAYFPFSRFANKPDEIYDRNIYKASGMILLGCEKDDKSSYYYATTIQNGKRQKEELSNPISMFSLHKGMSLPANVRTSAEYESEKAALQPPKRAAKKDTVKEATRSTADESAMKSLVVAGDNESVASSTSISSATFIRDIAREVRLCLKRLDNKHCTEYALWLNKAFELKQFAVEFAEKKQLDAATADALDVALYSEWNYWSSDAPNYNEDECLRKWNLAAPNGSRTIGSLLYDLGDSIKGMNLKYLTSKPSQEEMQKDMVAKMKTETAFNLKTYLTLESLDEQLEYVNYWFVETRGSKVLYHEKRILDDGSFEFIDRLERDTIPVFSGCLAKNERKTIFKVWQEWEGKHTFTKATIKPYSPVQGNPCKSEFNLFSGFKHHNSYNPHFAVETDRFQVILDHIFNVWCKRSKECYEYLLSWLAHIVQKPNVKTDVCVIVKSEFQGVGKGIVFDFISQNVFGNAICSTLSNIEHIFAEFNADQANTILTLLDEATDGGSAIRHSDQFKAKITNKRQRINKKGIDAFQADDCNNYLLNTNNDYIVKIESSDRRMFCLDCDSSYAGHNPAYFERMAKVMNDETGLHFYHWLLQRDISQFKRQDVPMTTWKNALQSKAKLSPFFQCLHNLGCAIRKNPTKFKGVIGWKDVLEAHPTGGLMKQPEKTQLIKSISDFLSTPETRVERKEYRTSSGKEYGWQSADINQEWFLQLMRMKLRNPQYELGEDDLEIDD
jgi:hypothetical protein